MEMRWVEETAIWESSWQLMWKMEFNCRGDAYLVFIYISRSLLRSSADLTPIGPSGGFQFCKHESDI